MIDNEIFTFILYKNTIINGNVLNTTQDRLDNQTLRRDFLYITRTIG